MNVYQNNERVEKWKQQLDAAYHLFFPIYFQKMSWSNFPWLFEYQYEKINQNISFFN